MVLNSYAAPLARRDSWLERIEVVDDYAESPYQRVADVLKQLGLAEETIGFEKSYVSADRWEEIAGPAAEGPDCRQHRADGPRALGQDPGGSGGP